MDADPYAHATGWDPDSDAYAHIDSHPHAHAHAVSDRDPHADRDSHAHSYAHTNVDPDRHTYANRHSDAYTYVDDHPDARATSAAYRTVCPGARAGQRRVEVETVGPGNAVPGVLGCTKRGRAPAPEGDHNRGALSRRSGVPGRLSVLGPC